MKLRSTIDGMMEEWKNGRGSSEGVHSDNIPTFHYSSLEFLPIIKMSVLILMLLLSKIGIAQTNDGDDTPKDTKSRKGFHAGIFAGSYFANRSTAAIYDGYGYDVYGVKNDFTNSFMNQRIHFDYGGGNGMTDQVAQALKVNPGEWTFDQTDMPQKMKYTPGIAVGIHTMFGFTQKDALLFNATATKLSANGVFTITLNTPYVGPSSPGSQKIQTFSISGSEQRALFQVGYRRILGDDNLLNFFVEGGAEINMVKLVRNQITINNLQIDLTTYYNYPAYFGFRAKHLMGVGVGAFAGMGLNLTANSKCNLQLVYDPSYQKINMGDNLQYKLQHTIGLRIYYNL